MRLDIKSSDLVFRSGSASASSENWWCLSELILALFPINPNGCLGVRQSEASEKAYLFAGGGVPFRWEGSTSLGTKNEV